MKNKWIIYGRLNKYGGKKNQDKNDEVGFNTYTLVLIDMRDFNHHILGIFVTDGYPPFRVHHNMGQWIRLHTSGTDTKGI